MSRVAVTLTLALLLLAWTAQAAAITLTARANRSRIYLGETVQLHVKVDGSNATDIELEFPDLQGATPQLIGTQDNSSRSIQIINGQFSRRDVLARTFVYQIKPAEAGRLAIGTIVAQQQGERATTHGPQIEVVGIEPRDDINVSLTASRETALVDESFAIELQVRVAALPPPYSDEEPLHWRQPPHLQADFLELAEIHGLQQPDLQQLLSQLATQGGRQPGFRLNNYVSRGFGGSLFNLGFGDPFEPQPYTFRLPPRRVTQQGRSFWEYHLQLDYTAQAEGDYTFGPVTFKGSIITGADAQGQAILEEIFTIGPAVTVRVTPPPEAGRPDSFIGTVGRDLQVKALLDTAICKVGDPLTLTLDITGQLSLSNLRPPLLELPPEAAANFRLYGEPHETENLAHGKRFRYRVRPLTAGTIEFPPIPVSWFDTESRSYQTRYTAPLPLQAQATTQIAALPDDDSAATWALSAAARLPDGIMLNATHGMNPLAVSANRRLALLLLLAPPLAYLLLLLLRTIWRRRAAWQAERRKRAALGVALRSFSQARRKLNHDPLAAGTAAAQALRRYFAVHELAAASATAAELRQSLAPLPLPTGITAPLLNEFEALEQLLFRPEAAGSSTLAPLLTSLPQALRNFDCARRRRQRQQPHTLSLLLLVLLASGTAGHATLPDSFTWERANQAMAGAQEQSDYQAAARLYHEMAAAGAQSGALFYNLGTALLLADEPRQAEAALLRAERLLGATPELRTNLRLATGLRHEQPDAPLPPAQYLFAWHFQLPLALRLWLALSGWALLWLGWSLRLATAKPLPHAPVPRRRTFTTMLLGLGVTLLLLFAPSVALTWLQERHDQHRSDCTATCCGGDGAPPSRELRSLHLPLPGASAGWRAADPCRRSRGTGWMCAAAATARRPPGSFARRICLSAAHRPGGGRQALAAAVGARAGYVLRRRRRAALQGASLAAARHTVAQPLLPVGHYGLSRGYTTLAVKGFWFFTTDSRAKLPLLSRVANRSILPGYGCQAGRAGSPGSAAAGSASALEGEAVSSGASAATAAVRTLLTAYNPQLTIHNLSALRRKHSRGFSPGYSHARSGLKALFDCRLKPVLRPRCAVRRVSCKPSTVSSGASGATATARTLLTAYNPQLTIHNLSALRRKHSRGFSPGYSHARSGLKALFDCRLKPVLRPCCGLLPQPRDPMTPDAMTPSLPRRSLWGIFSDQRPRNAGQKFTAALIRVDSRLKRPRLHPAFVASWLRVSNLWGDKEGQA